MSIWARKQSVTDPETLLRLWAAKVPMTHSEIAACMGRSRQGIAKIEYKALSKIRRAMEMMR